MDDELKNGKWFPYIKPTRYKHESGYRCFEVGYVGPRDTKVVMGSRSDHIWNKRIMFYNNQASFLQGLNFNIDLLTNGCIRFFAHEGALKWSYEQFANSTMELCEGEPDMVRIEQLYNEQYK